jgi:hypothetical protein
MIMKVIVGVRLFNAAEIVQCLLPSKVMWKGGLMSSLELHDGLTTFGAASVEYMQLDSAIALKK